MNAVQFYMLKGKDFSNAGRISISIKRYLREKNYPTQVIQRVAIMTYEAEINLACYTRYGYFFVYFLDDQIKIIVKDRGQGIEDIDLAMQEGFRPRQMKYASLDLARAWPANIKTRLSDNSFRTGSRHRLEFNVALNTERGEIVWNFVAGSRESQFRAHYGWTGLFTRLRPAMSRSFKRCQRQRSGGQSLGNGADAS